MPHRIDYAARYFRRLEDIHERTAEENPPAAARIVDRIQTAVERLRGRGEWRDVGKFWQDKFDK